MTTIYAPSVPSVPVLEAQDEDIQEVASCGDDLVWKPCPTTKRCSSRPSGWSWWEQIISHVQPNDS